MRRQVSRSHVVRIGAELDEVPLERSAPAHISHLGAPPLTDSRLQRASPTYCECFECLAARGVALAFCVQRGARWVRRYDGRRGGAQQS
jgi:hypothetical protein